MTFPALLRAALHRVNALGKPFSIGVIVAGIVIIILQAWLVLQLGYGLLAQLKVMVGDERFAVIEQQIADDGVGAGDVQSVSQLISEELTQILAPMTEVQRSAYFTQLISSVIRSAGPLLLFTGLLLILLHFLARADFLVLATHRSQTVLRTAADALRMFPRLLGVWIGVFLCSCLWLPGVIFVLGFFHIAVLAMAMPSLIVPAFLFPRFVFAPIILAEEGKGIRASLQESYERTQGKWWPVVRNLIGLFVVTWVFTSVLQNILDLLVTSLLPYSIYGIGLYALGSFIALMAMGYRTFFLVDLQRETARM